MVEEGAPTIRREEKEEEKDGCPKCGYKYSKLTNSYCLVAIAPAKQLAFAYQLNQDIENTDNCQEDDHSIVKQRG